MWLIQEEPDLPFCSSCNFESNGSDVLEGYFHCLLLTAGVCVCVWEEVVGGVMEALRDAELTYMVICINHLVNQWGPRGQWLLKSERARSQSAGTKWS